MALSVSVYPFPDNIATSDALRVFISVYGPQGRPADGSVVLRSGHFASFPQPVHGGEAEVIIAPGLLPAGTDTLTATYQPLHPGRFAEAKAEATVLVASDATLPTVSTTSVSYPTLGKPFEAVPDGDGHVLVSVTDEAATNVTGVQVFQQTSGGLTSPCDNLLRPAFQQAGVSIAGLSRFNHGSSLAAAVEDQGVLFFSTAAFASCSAQGTQVRQGAVVNGVGAGSFDTVVTRDGKYAFVANEYGYAPGSSVQGNIGVVALEYEADGTVSPSSHLVGQIATGGEAIAGILLSPDGKRLYVTSEIDRNNNPIGAGNPYLARTGCLQGAGSKPSINGLLSVVDVEKAEADPSPSAIISTVDAGCSPVRLLETKDQSALWVTVRGDNRLLAFSPGMLEIDPASALLGHVDNVGSQPVGMSFFHHEKLLAVANSNRFGGGTANAVIVYIAVPARAAVVDTLTTGLFPREFTTMRDDQKLLLTNYGSNTLQVFDPVVVR